jgi:hypothetical protein
MECILSRGKEISANVIRGKYKKRYKGIGKSGNTHIRNQVDVTHWTKKLQHVLKLDGCEMNHLKELLSENKLTAITEDGMMGILDGRGGKAKDSRDEFKDDKIFGAI